MKNIDNFYVTIQLTKKAHEDAQKFASKQANSQKVKQVYLNTLAVYAVYDFLEWLKIQTDLNAGDSWNSLIRSFHNVADLVIPNLGKLECRPVLPGETVISLPPEVSEDRIAYVGVQFQEQLNEVELLGFYPTIDPQAPLEEIKIANLQPIETLIDYLDRLESAKDLLESNEEVARKVREKLAERSISEIAAQLERIYRTCDKYERRYAGGDFLASFTTPQQVSQGVAAFVDREGFNLGELEEFQDLAERLFEKLDEIWGNEEAEESFQTEATIGIKAKTTTIATQPGIINLSRWLENIDAIFEDGWRKLEDFINTLEGNQIFRYASAPRSRSSVTEEPSISASRVEEIALLEQRMALLFSCQLESSQTRDILLRLYPLGEDNTYLPAGVQLTVLDETGDIFLEATARSADNWIQLEFRGEAGERFSIKIALGNDSATYSFVI
ncbi:hypothetical protein PCC9214_05787 [Planktothrix tepida]|uniref:DUF1822 domain-containing protein n=1 Tax=Planktothrix tepida PCC 9214 TaxID=671072 RepID=A0A1J1LTN7_9CYAN|nr:DUF1822 family protein [Planktothrix tepida]CAD5990403.1 hypothetical protein PCC9214_05787 [Planktothrix tepida]CUR35378.1 conserved hypothetical protein [Planktothrix tepida PCC 9214]